MKFWILEDSADTAEILKTRLGAPRAGAPVKVLRTMGEAERALGEIADEDVVFVDSQVPAGGAGGVVTDAGARFIAGLRARGCACRILWHSVNSSEPLSTLGVERVRPKDVGPALFAPGAAPAQAAMAEEWRREGEALLAKLTAAAPLSELATMSVLCQGYLAVVGAAGRFDNEVADELRKFEGGRECLEEARGHLCEALDTAEWFGVGRESIAEAVRRRGADEEDYWRGVGDGLEELEPDVAAVRALYESLRRAGAGEAGEEGGEAGEAGVWHGLVAGAHGGLQRLLARRYL